MSVQYQAIRVERLDGAVGLVTLNRPKQLNTLNDVMVVELILAFDELERDPAVKVVVVTGSGPTFCAGADLSGGNAFARAASGGGSHKDFRDPGGQVAARLARMNKPVVAAVNGTAVGFGITVTLPMDIRITHRDCKIGFIFARRGIVPESMSTFYLPKLVGHSRAVALMLQAKILPAQDEMMAGLFAKIVDKPGDVLPAALAMARDMASGCSPVSMAFAKSLIWRPASSPEGHHLVDSEAFYHAARGEDAAEGVGSFLEKRPPSFPGSASRRTGEDGYGLPADFPWWRAEDISAEDWPSDIGAYKRRHEEMVRSKAKV